jgi:pyrimidine-nucleoside phosphorylase
MYNTLIDDFARSPEDYFEQLITVFSKEKVDEDDILKLAYVLANSGECYVHNEFDLNTIDIPSTGGPSSLTTMLCPLYLVNNGYTVIKLGVPGRPAGGIDVLYQIDDYNIHYNTSELTKLMERGRYIHFMASNTFAPLDSKLYSYRKATGNMDIPSLVIASLLSKKIAVGIKNVGLEVRVWKHGNLGKSINEAREHAKLFIKLAKMAGINAKCFLSDASQPFQPYIGRGEALIAIYKIINHSANQWLRKHNSYCGNISSKMFLSMKKDIDIKEAFINNLELQGSTYDKFVYKVNQITEEPHYDIYSSKSGYCYYDLEYIRKHIVCEQNKAKSDISQFPDPCGYILMKCPGDYVEIGERIASYRTRNPETIKYADKMYYIEQQQIINIIDNEVIE